MAASKYLQAQGFQILDQNCRYKLHEVDLVVFDKTASEVVFVEVKTRLNDDFGEPSAAVGWKKVRSLERVALAYLREKKLGQYDFRFDVVSVTKEPFTVNHYPNITWEMVK